MAKKKSGDSRQVDIRVGDISSIQGTVNIAGGNISTSQTTIGLSAAEIENLFNSLFAKIEQRPETTLTSKEDLKAEVQEVQKVVTRAASGKEPADEGLLARHFRNIARMAPDILDVVVAT